MKKAICVMILFTAARTFAVEPPAVGVNKERAKIMIEILNSDRISNLLDSYGKENFVFDGMSWVNTASDEKYYDLKFKKFTLSVTENGGAKEFTEVITTCDHLVVVREGKITGHRKLTCQDSKSSIGN